MNLGFSLAALTAYILLTFFERHKNILLLLYSAVAMVVANILFTGYDYLMAESCAGRSIITYIFSYTGQICLEIYQTRKIVILASQNKIMKIFAFILFAIRAISLIVNWFYYFDPPKSFNGVCSTGFPIVNLIVEKTILVFFNLGNMVILLYLMKKSDKFQSSKELLIGFALQDGLTFIMAFFLDFFFVLSTALLQGTAIYSMTAALGNGFNMFILYVQTIITILKRMTRKTMTGRSESKNPTTTKSERQKEADFE